MIRAPIAERERDRPAARSPSRASAGGPPCTGCAAAGSGPAPSAGAGSRWAKGCALKIISPMKNDAERRPAPRSPRGRSRGGGCGSCRGRRSRRARAPRPRAAASPPGSTTSRSACRRSGVVVEEWSATSAKRKSSRRKAISSSTTAVVSSAGHRVDRAARGVDPAPVAGAARRGPRRPPRRARRAGRRPAVRSRGSSAGLPRCGGRELRRALGDQAVPLADEGAVLELAGDDHLAAVAERVGDRPGVGDRDRVGCRRGPRSGSRAGRPACWIEPGTTVAGQLIGLARARTGAAARAPSPRSRR